MSVLIWPYVLDHSSAKRSKDDLFLVSHPKLPGLYLKILIFSKVYDVMPSGMEYALLIPKGKLLIS